MGEIETRSSIDRLHFEHLTPFTKFTQIIIYIYKRERERSKVKKEKRNRKRKNGSISVKTFLFVLSDAVMSERIDSFDL